MCVALKAKGSTTTTAATSAAEAPALAWQLELYRADGFVRRTECESRASPVVVCVWNACAGLRTSRGMWCLRNNARALAWRREPVCARVLVPPNPHIHTYDTHKR